MTLPGQAPDPIPGPIPGPEEDVVRAARTLEWLKAELTGGVAAVFRTLVQGRQEAVLDGLADILLSVYLLARRLGINATRLDLRVEHKLRVNIDQEHQLEQWYGDLTALAQHFRQKREWGD